MKYKFIKGMGLFLESPNASEPGIFISEFEPYIEKNSCILNMKTGKKTNYFTVNVKDINGQTRNGVTLSSLHKIPYFELFGQPDSLLNSHSHALLEYKLQKESSKMGTETIPLYPNGFYHTIDGTPVFVLGDCIIGTDIQGEYLTSPPSACKKDFSFNPLYRMKKPCANLPAKNVWLEEARHFILFRPGITEIIFYGSLLAIVKPFLTILNYSPDVLINIIGDSGSLKTSMVCKYALWSDHPEQQKISLQSCTRMPAILSHIENFTGMNFVIDDIHSAGPQQEIQQRDRLDKLVRFNCDHPDCANIFVTGESMKNKAIFSAYDRMFQITVPKESDETLQKLKYAINSLPDSFMSQLAVEFAKKLLASYDSVLSDIQNFITKYEPLGFEEPSTRMLKHIQILRLVEHLYATYMCDSNCNWSCKEQFESALKKHAIYQQHILLHQRKAEENVNYIKAVYECLSANDKYITIITDSTKYQLSMDTCLLENNRIYITSEALTKSLTDFLGKPVKPTAVAKILKENGVLESDLDALSKKKKGRRHYVIHWFLLKNLYYNMPDFL